MAATSGQKTERILQKDGDGMAMWRCGLREILVRCRYPNEMTLREA
jgi:hypothetical protein